MAMEKRKQKLGITPVTMSARTLDAPQELSEIEYEANRSTSDLT